MIYSQTCLTFNSLKVYVACWCPSMWGGYRCWVGGWLAGDSAVMPASPLSPPSPATLGITAGPAAAAPVPNMLAGRASGTIQYVLASSKHNKLAQWLRQKDCQQLRKDKILDWWQCWWRWWSCFPPPSPPTPWTEPSETVKCNPYRHSMFIFTTPLAFLKR